MLSSDMEFQPSELSEVDGSGDGAVESTLGEEHSKAQEFKAIGNDKFQKANYKGAIIDYKKGLLHEPNNSDLHANLSAAYLHLEKFIDAEEHALFAIHLKPEHYKGYLRAAKAAHGKGLTKLGIHRLNSALNVVTDPNGVKELTRLKTQYTSYLSLQSNAEREMDIDFDRYESEEEDVDDVDLDFSDDDGSDDEPPDEGIVVGGALGNESDLAMSPKTISVPAETMEKPKVNAKADDVSKSEELQRKEKLTNVTPVKGENINGTVLPQPKSMVSGGVVYCPVLMAHG